jgi:hypothetical protein
MGPTVLANSLGWAMGPTPNDSKRIAQGYYAFQLVHVSAANYWQKLEAGRAHALKGFS